MAVAKTWNGRRNRRKTTENRKCSGKGFKGRWMKLIQFEILFDFWIKVRTTRCKRKRPHKLEKPQKLNFCTVLPRAHPVTCPNFSPFDPSPLIFGAIFYHISASFFAKSILTMFGSRINSVVSQKKCKCMKLKMYDRWQTTDTMVLLGRWAWNMFGMHKWPFFR